MEENYRISKRKFQDGLLNGELKLLVQKEVATIFDADGKQIKSSMRSRDRKKWPEWAEEITSPERIGTTKIYK